MDNRYYEDKNYHELSIPLFPGISFDYFWCDGSYEFRAPQKIKRSSNVMIINYCYCGSFEMIYNNGKILHRGAKDITLSSPDSMSAHSRIPQKTYEGISITLRFSEFPDWLTCFFSEQNIDFQKLMRRFRLEESSFFVPRTEELENSFDNLYRYMEEGRRPLLLAETLLLISKISLIGEEGKEEEEDYTSLMTDKVYRKVLKIAKEMEKSSNYSVPLADLVDREGLNYGDFQKVFFELFHMAPIQYRRNQKINEGAFLIQHTNKSITEIAFLCGYSNPSKFSSAFRQLMGISPLKYRSRHAVIK